MGHNPEKARNFYDEKVNFVFGEFKNKIIPPHYSKLDAPLYKAIQLIGKGDYLGSIAHSKDGGYEFALNTPKIQEQFPNPMFSNLKDTFETRDYSSQTLEERIASVEQTIDSITKHEFYHLIQWMDEPELMDKMTRKAIATQRMLGTWAACAITTSFIVPEYTIFAAGSGVFVIGAGLLTVRDGKDKVEKDARVVQRKASEISLVKSPFTYIHESDPKK